jgi:signal transduction histidine kinase
VTPRLRISAERSDAGWCFTVADNGIGIREADREKVFGMFARLHSREEYPGTGIGLAIVQKVVRRHGGRVWIEDNPGGGARVSFILADPVGAPDG